MKYVYTSFFFPKYKGSASGSADTQSRVADKGFDMIKTIQLRGVRILQNFGLNFVDETE